MKNEILLLMLIGLFLFVSGIYVSKLHVISKCTDDGFITLKNDIYIKCEIINRPMIQVK